MNNTVTPKWMSRPQMGVLKGRFCMKSVGKGVMPSLASSWITRAFLLVSIRWILGGGGRERTDCKRYTK